MLNSAASALVNSEPAGAINRELIGQNLASQYGNMDGKTESLKAQLESLNVINRDDINGRIKMASRSRTAEEEDEDGEVKQSLLVANVNERKEISPGIERNKRVLPTTPKSLYSTPSQSATSVTRGLNVRTPTNSKRHSSSSSISSASNTSSISSSVSSEPEEDLRYKSNVKQTHIVVYKFVARHDDEINLDIGDAIHVDKKCEDLWFEGLNLRTGKAGIFPSRYVSDILQEASIQGEPAFLIFLSLIVEVKISKNIFLFVRDPGCQGGRGEEGRGVGVTGGRQVGITEGLGASGDTQTIPQPPPPPPF